MFDGSCGLHNICQCSFDLVKPGFLKFTVQFSLLGDFDVVFLSKIRHFRCVPGALLIQVSIALLTLSFRVSPQMDNDVCHGDDYCAEQTARHQIGCTLQKWINRQCCVHVLPGSKIYILDFLPQTVDNESSFECDMSRDRHLPSINLDVL